MKLKAIFIIFNVLIGISFLFVFLMPAFFLGWQYAGVFWSSNWYLALLFVVVLALLDTYFIYNWRLFTSLEREDWDSVISVLEARVREKKRYGNGNIRLLVNAYVVRGRTESIAELETLLRNDKPRMLRKNALVLGIPHLLSNDGAEISSYFGEFIDGASGTEAEWLRWSRGFGMMLQQKSEDARVIFHELCTDATDTVVRALSGYLLEAYAGDSADERGRIDKCRTTITDTHSVTEWDGIVEKARSELYVLILSKLLRDVREWLYGASE